MVEAERGNVVPAPLGEGCVKLPFLYIMLGRL